MNNVLFSWVEAAGIFDFSLNICFPKILKVSGELKEKIKIAKSNVEISHDAKQACKNCDCIITDTWFSMGKKPTKKLIKVFKPYQVNKKIMSFAKKKCDLHALPPSY